MTDILIASENGLTDSVQLLLDKGENVNEKNNEGESEISHLRTIFYINFI